MYKPKRFGTLLLATMAASVCIALYLHTKSVAQSPPQSVRRPRIPNHRSSEKLTFEAESGDRVAAARGRCGVLVRSLFEQTDISYPAHELFLRVFKREGELEVWARNSSGTFKLIASYSITKASGMPGPKRREGDQQVPEGLYEVDRFNPESMFHLSLGINYPNASDQLLSDPERPGNDIFIHGSAVSIGCMPLGDDRIEEVYLMALDSRVRPIPVHIFPARMQGDDWLTWSAEQTHSDPTLKTFWEQLQPAYDAFAKTSRLPKYQVLKDGSYQFATTN